MHRFAQEADKVSILANQKCCRIVHGCSLQKARLGRRGNSITELLAMHTTMRSRAKKKPRSCKWWHAQAFMTDLYDPSRARQGYFHPEYRCRSSGTMTNRYRTGPIVNQASLDSKRIVKP